MRENLRSMLQVIGTNVHGVAGPILEIPVVWGSPNIAGGFQEMASGNIHSNPLYLG